VKEDLVQEDIRVPGQLLDAIFDCAVEPKWKEYDYVVYRVILDDENLVRAYLLSEDGNEAESWSYEPQELVRLMRCIKNGRCRFVE